MIINNYTGDRLNFGLAIETARNVYKYRNIKAITIDDDCAIDNPCHSTGRRGLMGINLVTKIAGAMSTRGYSLNEIHERCSSLLSNRLIRTIGFSFHHHHDQLSNIEIGYGIHGEPGIIKIQQAHNFKAIIEVMQKKLEFNENSKVILLFNNLGGASEFIFYAFIKEFLDAIEAFSIQVIKIYGGKFLTSLGKEGIGVSVMEVRDEQLLTFLDDPVDVPAKELFNSLLCVNSRSTNFEIPSRQREQEFESIVEECEIELARKVVTNVCVKIIEAQQLLNEMDSELGDGDTGTTIARGAECILQELKINSLKLGNPHAFLSSLSDILMKSMGGSSGALFSIFFQCASNAFTCNNKYSITNWREALLFGMKGIMEYGKAEIGNRTLLDSLNPGYKAMKRIKSNSTIEAVMEFANACEEGMEETKTMKPKSGRAAYSINDCETKFSSQFPDAGAFAISLISNCILECFKLRN